MPRPPRVHVTGALYYVTSKALEGMSLFRDADDYRTYVDLLKGYQIQYGFKLFAFALLPDHLHLCLELTSQETISDVMHALTSRYTKHHNKRYGHAGHLFQERFKATIAEKAPWLLLLTGYLHTHPARTGVSGDWRSYPWSSGASYLAVQTSSEGRSLGGEAAEVLQQLAVEHPGSAYQDYIQSMPEAAWDDVRSALTRWVIGSERFVSLMEQQRRSATVRPTEPIRSQANAAFSSHRRMSPIVTGSLAVTALSVCAVILYATHLSALRQTLQALTKERSIPTIAGAIASHAAHPTARLASTAMRSRLNGSVWEVEVRSADAQGEMAQKDWLEFAGGKLTSRQLSAEGFSPSNYTLTMQDSGTIAWETMQTNSAGTVVCWRGEWDGQTMRGVLTRQVAGEAVSNYSFAGTSAAQPHDSKSVTSNI